MVKRLSVVENPFLKPVCSTPKISKFSRKIATLLLRTLVNSFPKQDNKLIPL